MANLQTLPTLSASWGISVEVVRKLVRRDPALRALGVRLGNMRAYSPTEADVIRAALDAHRARWSRFHSSRADAVKPCAAT